MFQCSIRKNSSQCILNSLNEIIIPQKWSDTPIVGLLWKVLNFSKDKSIHFKP